MRSEEKIYDLESYLKDGRLTEMPDGEKDMMFEEWRKG